MRKSNQRIVNHGASGKGDKDRTADSATFNANLGQVKFSGVPASQDGSFCHVGGKSIKRYGTECKPVTFATVRGRVIIH
jgi:hypothetical protein